MKKIFFSVAIFLSIAKFSPVNGQINTPSGAIIPFGSNKVYAGGLLPSNLPTTGTYAQSTDAATAYNNWKNSYVVACGANYRVLFDDPTKTVSEGIAYGMLLSAYAADKALFDGLWAYYKANSNGNGVMNWTINGCSGSTSTGGATDAELDAATALLVAATQWPLSTSPYVYQTEAVTLIRAIQSKEMNASGTLFNGDGWSQSLDCRNPSYHAPAYFRLFAVADPTNATFWNNAVTPAYTLINANANATTGLVSDWSGASGATNACQTGSVSGQYGYDACRNPWRMSTDVAWWGATTGASGQAICNKIATYISGKGATAVGGPVPQAGGTGGHYATFVSTFAAGCVGSTNQTILDQMYSQAVGVSDLAQNANPSGYFGNTLRCISLFTMTGNFWKPGSSPTAEINIQQNNTNIPSASTYSLGNITQGTTATYTFTIQNIGGTPLTVGAISITGATAGSTFTVSTLPASSVAVNSTTTFVVTLVQAGGTVGAISATMSIVNNDATGGENPYVINLTATSTANATAPIVKVDYKGTTIVTANSPAYSLGSITQSAASGYYTFTITNTGTAPLSVQTIAITGTANGYSVSAKPTLPASVPIGGTVTFTVAVVGSATAGAQNGTVTITATGVPNYVINLTLNVVTCTTSMSSTYFLDDYEGNVNVIKVSAPTGTPFNEVATNPAVNATNPSPVCLLYTRLATGIYDQIRYKPTCATTFPASTKKGISMLVYSPAPGIPIVISTKAADGTTSLGDIKSVTTKTNAWEKLFFDLTPVTGIISFLDIQVDPTPAPGVTRTFYFDDLKYEDPACITDLPSSQVFMDYDAHRNLSLLWLYAGTSTLNEAFANPSATGLNTSPTVAKFVRQAIAAPTLNYTQGWRYVGCQQKIDFSNKTAISMLVYSGAVGIPISMTILNNTATAVAIGSATVNTTLANAWEKLYFDFATLAGNTTGAYMDIAPDPNGTYITPAASLTYYFDNIQYDVMPTITGVTASEVNYTDGLMIYPNPNDGNFTVSFYSGDRSTYQVEVLNTLGQIISKEEVKDFTGSYSKQISLMQYGQGVYIIRLTNAKNGTVKKMIVY